MAEYSGPLVDAPIGAKPKQRPYTPLQQVTPTQSMPTQSTLSPKSQEALELEKAKNSNGRGLKETIHGHHNGIEPTKQSSQSEKVGQYINALAQGAANLSVDKVFRIWD